MDTAQKTVSYIVKTVASYTNERGQVLTEHEMVAYEGDGWPEGKSRFRGHGALQSRSTGMQINFDFEIPAESVEGAYAAYEERFQSEAKAMLQEMQERQRRMQEQQQQQRIVGAQADELTIERLRRGLPLDGGGSPGNGRIIL